MIDRRALLGAGAVVVVAPFSSPSLAQDTYFTDLHDMAKKEGEISWYLTHWRTETAERVGNLFMQTWPGVRCNVVRSTGQVLFQRLIQETLVHVSPPNDVVQDILSLGTWPLPPLEAIVEAPVLKAE